MTRDEETYFLRLMQVADKSTLLKHFTLTEQSITKDDCVFLAYDVHYNKDSGYLKIKFQPEPLDLRMAEMNVGFPTLIGLNRSPLELRMLVEHILDVLYTPES